MKKAGGMEESVMEDSRMSEAESRRTRAILGHVLAPANSFVEPSNVLSISLTSAGPDNGQQQHAATVTVRIGDVSLTVPRPIPVLVHCVPALYLSGKGQVCFLRVIPTCTKLPFVSQQRGLLVKPILKLTCRKIYSRKIKMC